MVVPSTATTAMACAELKLTDGTKMFFSASPQGTSTAMTTTT